MSMRKSVSARKDKAVFTRTATKSKSINLAPRVMRGGIRL